MSLAFDRRLINDLKRELDVIGCQVPLESHGQGYKDMSPVVDIVERLVVRCLPPSRSAPTWPSRRAIFNSNLWISSLKS